MPRIGPPRRRESRDGVAGIARVALAAVASIALMAPVARAQRTLTVAPGSALSTVTAALAQARDGDRIVVTTGTYREPMLVVRHRVELVGQGAPVLDGESQRQIMSIAANGVTVRGFTFRNVGVAMTQDLAALKVAGARDCRIEDNRVENAFFGIYLERAEDCVVRNNVLLARKRDESNSGNGIHLYSARHVTIAGNRIEGHRDGIYLEFSRHTVVKDNVSEGNLRYGLHFMYSDSCRYERNHFRENLAGVAVMYTKQVDMIGNTFEHNWGSASYGLLLKEVYDVRLERNRFARNTVGLVADGAERLHAVGNRFTDNGWAVRLMASTQEASFEGNDFSGNTFDVATNGRESSTRFDGNYFDGYEGYDLDRDGVGDVPHRPVRLFSLIVERNEPAMILLRSFFVGLLDVAERVLPALTPEALVDDAPRMRPVS
jgi:nitrous oxidase accessory protein